MNQVILQSPTNVIELTNITAASTVDFTDQLKNYKIDQIIAVGDTISATLGFGTAASGTQFGTATATAANTEYPVSLSLNSVAGGFTLHLTPSAGTWSVWVTISPYKQ